MTCTVRHATKKAFREAVAADPSRVLITDPSLFKPFNNGDGFATDMAVGQRLCIAGPAPARKWFANITRTATGFKVA
jgi:hypothetical protein